MRTLVIFLSFLSLVIYGCANDPVKQNATDQAQSNTETAHAHLSLVAYPDRILSKDDDIRVQMEMINKAYLNLPGLSTKNPLAPCGLLVAGIISSQTSGIFLFGLGQQKTIPIPPKNSYILGKYDEDIKGGKISRDNPGKAAEIIARLYIWHSWEINGLTNVLLKGKNQQQCLDLLFSNPKKIGTEIRKIEQVATPVNVMAAVILDFPAVANYSSTFSMEEAAGFFNDLRGENFMGLSSNGTRNPLAPCSLLRAVWVGKRLNVIWYSLLTRNNLLSKREVVLAKFILDLKNENLLLKNPVETARIASFLFGKHFVGENHVADILLADATQQECLNELFEPGLIFSRLIKEGELSSSLK